ncbi:MAG: hypothetical protein HOW73_05970 [Polyangiaceae bacterium]|nr:hypothetical protein [Polyangiaceae bacterium]
MTIRIAATAAFFSVFGIVTEGLAEEPGAPAPRIDVPADAAPMTPPPPPEYVRVGLGMGLMFAGGLNAPVSVVPLAVAGVDVHMFGPAWLVLRANGNYADDELNGQSTKTYGVGGRIGVRLEAPLFDWLEAGGYGALQGQYSKQSSSGLTGPLDSQTGWFGGVIGASAHLRPTRFFGVRLGLDVLRAGHAWSTYGEESYESTSVAFEPSPSVELTFTF